MHSLKRILAFILLLFVAWGGIASYAEDNILNFLPAFIGKKKPVGDPPYNVYLQSAITAIGSNEGILQVPPGTHSIAADLSIPANVSLIVEEGAVLSVATGKTLTINGDLEAGLYQIFSCTGTGAVVLGNRVPRVFVHWTGAVGNNTTDDSKAINLAATIARASACKRIAFSSCAGYKATTQLDLTNLSIESNAQIYSTYAGTRVKCGMANKLDIKLQVDGTKDWINDAIIGIWVSQINNGVFDLSSSHSTIGVKFEAGTGSCSYNKITLRELNYNKVGLMVHVPSGVTGWCNENLVLGGNFGNGATTGAECCVKFLGEGANFIDKWTFVKPSFEYADGTATVITTKTQNLDMQDVRYECGSAVPVAQFKDRSYWNIISLGSVAHVPFTWDVAPLTSSPYGTQGCDVRMVQDYTLHCLTDTASFGAAYNDGTYLHVPGFELFNATTGTPLRKMSAAFNLMDGDGGACLGGTGAAYDGVGITVNLNYSAVSPPNTQWAKKLYVEQRFLGGGNYYTYIFVKCYDSAGNILSGSSIPYVQGNQWQSIGDFYKIGFGGANQALIFHPSVAKALIGLSSTSGRYPAGLEILSPYQANGYLAYTGPKELPGVLYAANAPTKWHFQVGERVYNDAPAVGQPQGWVCVKRTETTLAVNGRGGDLTITVADASGVASGDVIGIKLNTGLYHFTTINGAPAGPTVTLTSALPGTGVVATTGNAVVANLWHDMPDL